MRWGFVCRYVEWLDHWADATAKCFLDVDTVLILSPLSYWNQLFKLVVWLRTSWLWAGKMVFPWPPLSSFIGLFELNTWSDHRHQQCSEALYSGLVSTDHHDADQRRCHWLIVVNSIINDLCVLGPCMVRMWLQRIALFYSTLVNCTVFHWLAVCEYNNKHCPYIHGHKCLC